MPEITDATTNRPRFRRLDLFRIIAALGLLGCVAISWPLWWTRQDIPLIPIHQIFANWPGMWNTGITWAVLLALVCLLGHIHYRWSALTVTLGLFLLVCLDLTRMQPWVFHFGCLFLVIECYHRQPEKANWLPLARMLHICIYIWSGWHKCNPNFSTGSLHFFLQPLPEHIRTPLASNPKLMMALGLAVVLIEMGIGLLYLVSIRKRRLRYAPLLLATTMHLLLVAFFIKVGYDANVIPWNLTMFALGWVLFWPRSMNDKTGIREAFRQQKGYLRPVWIALWLLFAVLPGFHTLGDRWWDANLSFSLYSSHFDSYNILIKHPHGKQLPPHTRTYLSPPMQIDGLSKLSKNKELESFSNWEANRWAMKRFRTTIPPTGLFGRALFRTLCHTWPTPSALRLEHHRTRWWGQSNSRPSHTQCNTRKRP